MRNIMEETSNGFSIACHSCKRSNCNYEFTENNNLVLHCKACGKTNIIFR